MAERAFLERKLPVGAIDTRASGWWAMIFTVFTEASLFAYLLFSYYYLAVQPHLPGTFPARRRARSLTLALPNTIILLASSGGSGAGRNSVSSMARKLAPGGGIRPGRRAGADLPDHSIFRMGREAFRPFLVALLLALFHHHRLPHGACGGGSADPAGPHLLVVAGAISTASATPISISARSIGILSMRSGWRCSSPSTSRRCWD